MKSDYSFCVYHMFTFLKLFAVADPDLQMGGGGHPDPEIRGGWSPKKFILPLQASV